MIYLFIHLFTYPQLHPSFRSTKILVLELLVLVLLVLLVVLEVEVVPGTTTSPMIITFPRTKAPFEGYSMEKRSTQFSKSFRLDYYMQT